MAAGAIIGALGTIGSMAQGLMPAGQGSMNTLNPAQLYMQALTMKSLLPKMGQHYETLGSLGQNAPDAYGSLPSFQEDYVTKIYNPQRSRDRSNMEMLQDRVHESKRKFNEPL